MGLLSELKVAVPWGHLAAKAWGSTKGHPVLCLHGWLDNANSFDRLIPLLPQDFHYVALDFSGHGLSSHHSPGFPYYQQNFASEVRRVAAALKWDRFSLMGHSFGGIVGGMFSCLFPEMVDKLIFLDTLPLVLEDNDLENMLSYRRRAIEHVLQVEASGKPPSVVGPQDMLQRFLKNNTHVGEECGKLLLQRGTTQVAGGLVLNRDPRITSAEFCLDFFSRELFLVSMQQLQAHVLSIKAVQGFYDLRDLRPERRESNESNRELLLFTVQALRSALRERFQFVEVPGNHYVHMNQPHHVAGIISSFLQRQHSIPDMK